MARNSSASETDISLTGKLNSTGILLLTCALCASGYGQVLYGSLTGTVIDPSRAAIAGAKVEAVELSTRVTQQAATDPSGIYRFTHLLPGTYKVTISAQGFAALDRPNVDITTNETQRIDAQLKVGSATQTVSVTMDPQLLQTDTSDVHTDLGTTEIAALPAISSEGRSFQALYRIVPGASLPFENNSAAGKPATRHDHQCERPVIAGQQHQNRWCSGRLSLAPE